MISSRLFRHPLWIQSETHLWGSDPEEWVRSLDAKDNLLRFSDLEDILPQGVWQKNKAGLLIPEIACFPLKVETDHKVPAHERESFLKWHLKKRLPFSAEDALIRYMPMVNPNQWLVFSLPGNWVEETFQYFKNKDVQLGYIGCIAGLFMESLRGPEHKVLLAFQHYYVHIHLVKGRVKHFQLRRYPENNGAIQFDEFLPTDFGSEGLSKTQIICLHPDRVEEWRQFRLSNPGQIPHFIGMEGHLTGFLKTGGES